PGGVLGAGTHIDHGHRAQVQPGVAATDGPGGGPRPQLLGAGDGVLQSAGRDDASPHPQAAAAGARLLGSLAQDLARQPSGGDGLDQGVVRLAQHLLVVAPDGGAQAQQVGAGLDGSYDGLLVAGLSATAAMSRASVITRPR